MIYLNCNGHRGGGNGGKLNWQRIRVTRKEYLKEAAVNVAVSLPSLEDEESLFFDN